MSVEFDTKVSIEETKEYSDYQELRDTLLWFAMEEEAKLFRENRIRDRRIREKYLNKELDND
jgi:hypothetical protein